MLGQIDSRSHEELEFLRRPAKPTFTEFVQVSILIEPIIGANCKYFGKQSAISSKRSSLG